MYKGFLPEVSKEVGTSAAILLNQLVQWFKSSTKEKIYRTNAGLAEDLGDILSVATIQRCKERLISAGYITVSYDKGIKRDTHYQLTEKAKLLFGLQKVVEVVEKVQEAVGSTVEKVVDAFKKPKSEYKKPKPTYTKNPNNAAQTKSMKEAFENYGKRDKAMPCPENLLEKLKGLIKPKEEEPVVQPIPTKPAGSIYSRVPSVENLNRNMRMREEAKNFCEDY